MYARLTRLLSGADIGHCTVNFRPSFLGSCLPDAHVGSASSVDPVCRSFGDSGKELEFLTRLASVW